MAEPTATKELLVPLEAGLVVMERYGLYSESRDNWTDPLLAPVVERVHTAHAPYDMEIKEKKYRINIASPQEKFREYSVRVLENFIRAVKQAPNCKLVVTHPAPHYWSEDAGHKCEIKEVGDYGRMVESLKRLSRVAAEMGVSFVVENNRVPWKDIPPGENFQHEKHHGKIHEYFACAPNEWASLPNDVNEPNFGLCFDTSHAVTYAQRFPVEAREGIVALYLTLASDKVFHAHWSDNQLLTNEGRDDLHLGLGKGTIPRKVHQQIWNSPSIKTCLFEHWTHEGDLSDETRYVERL